jgi:hypothetical protein
MAAARCLAELGDYAGIRPGVESADERLQGEVFRVLWNNGVE